jgi:hypothetical protein
MYTFSNVSLFLSEVAMLRIIRSSSCASRAAREKEEIEKIIHNSGVRHSSIKHHERERESTSRVTNTGKATLSCDMTICGEGSNIKFSVLCCFVVFIYHSLFSVSHRASRGFFTAQEERTEKFL